MKMKKFTMMILALAAFVSAGAENYFRNGTVWTVSIKDPADPTVVNHQEVYSFGDEVKIGDSLQISTEFFNAEEGLTIDAGSTLEIFNY